MKTSFTTPLAVAALAFTFGCTSLMADITDSTTTTHGTNVTSSTHTNKKMRKDTSVKMDTTTSDRLSHSGFTTGVGSNPADHGINNSTATHPGDNGLNSGVGSSNDIKGSSTATPPVNSADLNSKAGKGIKADTEKQGR